MRLLILFQVCLLALLSVSSSSPVFTWRDVFSNSTVGDYWHGSTSDFLLPGSFMHGLSTGSFGISPLAMSGYFSDGIVCALLDNGNGSSNSRMGIHARTTSPSNASINWSLVWNDTASLTFEGVTTSAVAAGLSGHHTFCISAFGPDYKFLIDGVVVTTRYSTYRSVGYWGLDYTYSSGGAPTALFAESFDMWVYSSPVPVYSEYLLGTTLGFVIVALILSISMDGRGRFLFAVAFLLSGLQFSVVGLFAVCSIGGVIVFITHLYGWFETV